MSNNNESDDILDDWKPMSEDYNSVHFNSYMTGQPGAQLPSRHNPTTDAFRLFISGLPTDLTQTGLNAYLRRIGCKHVNVNIIRVSSRNNKPFGIIDFDCKRDTLNAMELIETNRNLFKFKVTIAGSEQQMRYRNEAIERELKSIGQKQTPITE